MRLRDFQQDINKKFKLLGEVLIEFSESVQSPRARAFLSSALEFIKPHHIALGLRVSRLSTTRIEVVVPFQSVEPGVLTTAAVMGAQLLLRRLDQPQLGDSVMQETHFRFVAPVTSQLRGRLEFAKIAQESLRADLKRQGTTQVELVMAYFDESERLVADCTLLYQCRNSDQLTWKGPDDPATHTN
jgi:hypothetical protein